jgi:hypothetical protein
VEEQTIRLFGGHFPPVEVVERGADQGAGGIRRRCGLREDQDRRDSRVAS